MRQRVAGFTQAVNSSPDSTPTPMVTRPRKRRRVITLQSTHVSETEFADSESSIMDLTSPRYGTRSSELLTEIDTPSGVASGFTDHGKPIGSLSCKANLMFHWRPEGFSLELA